MTDALLTTAKLLEASDAAYERNPEDPFWLAISDLLAKLHKSSRILTQENRQPAWSETIAVGERLANQIIDASDSNEVEPTDGIFGTASPKETVKFFLLQMEMQRILTSLIEEADRIYRAEHGDWDGEPPEALTPIVQRLADKHHERENLQALMVANGLHEMFKPINAELDVTEISGHFAKNVIPFGRR